MASERSPSVNSAPIVVRDDFAVCLPETVFVLAQRGQAGPGPPEVWRSERGERLAAVYSSLTLLVAACGDGAPWVEVGRNDLESACDRLGITMVTLDAALPEVPHYPAPDVRTQPDLAEQDEVPVDCSLLYVPSRPVREGQREVRLELQPYQGKRALLAFTSPEELAAGCGQQQA